MPDSEEVPPADIPAADFVAWMTAEAPELAGAGRRLSRQRQPKILGERTRSARRRPRVRTVIGVTAFVAVLAVLLSLPFVPGWMSHPAGTAAGSSTPSARAAVEDTVFPPMLGGAVDAYRREAFSDPGGCTSTAGVSAALLQTVAAAGACETIRTALYVDARTRFRIEVCVIVMSSPADVPGLLELAAAPSFGFIPASRPLPPGDGKVYSGGLTGSGRTLVLSIGEYFQGVNGDRQSLLTALQAVNVTMAAALGLTPPVQK